MAVGIDSIAGGVILSLFSLSHAALSYVTGRHPGVFALSLSLLIFDVSQVTFSGTSLGRHFLGDSKNENNQIKNQTSLTIQ